MKSRSILDIATTASKYSIIKISLIFFFIFSSYFINKTVFSKLDQMDNFIKSTTSYIQILLQTRDSFELTRNLNSFIKSNQIDAYEVIDLNSNVLISTNSKSGRAVSVQQYKKVSIRLEGPTYLITKSFIISKHYQVSFIKSFSIYPVLVDLFIFLSCLITIVYLIIRNIKTVANSLANPLSNYSHFIKSKVSIESENDLSFNSPILEICQINQELNSLKSKLKKQSDVELNLKESLLLKEITTQVSHDIRSPLAALNMITKDLDILPESTRLLLRGSINRIQDIANNLLQKNKEGGQSDENKTSEYLIAPIIEDIISEKRTLLRSKMNILIESDTRGIHGSFSKINQSHLKRLLSNLINNSLDAFGPNSGNIRVSLSKVIDKADHTKKLQISVKDNGTGIPEHIISKLGKIGVSFGKDNLEGSGSGVGLYHAKKSIESWGGSFNIYSSVGVGTDIVLTIPESSPPSWFTQTLSLNSSRRIIIVDDDSSIHRVWDKRFNEVKLDHSLEIIHFTSPDEVTKWIKNQASMDNLLFLCDYEFIGHKENGLDIIKKNGIEKQSILVTSRYEESSVMTDCDQLAVKLIPKMMVETVPITIIKENEIDCIHLDDDDLIRMCWSISAKKANKKIRAFSSPIELFSALPQIPKKTPFYIDSCLGEEVIKGQDLAKKLFAQGYENLYMSTGFDRDKFTDLPWIKDTIGKTPPWDLS